MNDTETIEKQEARSGSLERLVRADPGAGWRLLNEGEPLQAGDGFLHPDYPGFWTDYECRPDIFRGGGSAGSWYHVQKNDNAHTWPWRRRIGPNAEVSDAGRSPTEKQ